MSNFTESLRRERDEYARQSLYWCPRCQTYKPGGKMQKRSGRSRYGFGPYCLSCEKERQKESRIKEKNRRYRQRYYQENKEKLLAYSRKWRQENKEWLQEYGRQRPNKDERREQIRLHWRSLPKEERRARSRKKYLKQKDKQIARQKAHYHTPKGKMQHQVWRKRYAARKAELPSDFTPSNWESALEYWEHKCAYCKQADVTDQRPFHASLKRWGIHSLQCGPYLRPLQLQQKKHRCLRMGKV